MLKNKKDLWQATNPTIATMAWKVFEVSSQAVIWSLFYCSRRMKGWVSFSRILICYFRILNNLKKNTRKFQHRYNSNRIYSVQIAHSLGKKKSNPGVKLVAGVRPNGSLIIVNISTSIIHFYLLEEIFLCDVHMFIHFLVAATWTK